MIEKFADKNFLAPEIAWAGNCRTCQQLISLAAEHYPHCGIKIEPDEMIVSTVNYVLLTFDGGIYLFLGVSMMYCLISCHFLVRYGLRLPPASFGSHPLFSSANGFNVTENGKRESRHIYGRTKN